MIFDELRNAGKETVVIVFVSQIGDIVVSRFRHPWKNSSRAVKIDSIPDFRESWLFSEHLAHFEIFPRRLDREISAFRENTDFQNLPSRYPIFFICTFLAKIRVQQGPVNRTHIQCEIPRQDQVFSLSDHVRLSALIILFRRAGDEIVYVRNNNYFLTSLTRKSRGKKQTILPSSVGNWANYDVEKQLIRGSVTLLWKKRLDPSV